MPPSDVVIVVKFELEMEHAAGTIPGAVFIPRGHLEAQAETRIDRSKPVVVYCAGGNRSAAARALGIGRRTLYTKMEKLGIQKMDREGKAEALPPSA